MSCLIGQNFRFLHMPKTGGTWVHDVITRWLQLPCVVDNRYGGHVPLRLALGEGLPTLTYVRNPFRWYESYYRYRCTTGWQDPPGDAGVPITKFGQAGECFAEFMSGLLSKYPNWLPDLVHAFTSFRAPDPLVTIGRHETLAADLERFLNDRGVLYSRHMLHQRAQQLVNLSIPVPTVWTPELVRKVETTHGDVLEYFKYTFKP